ncbi:MAG: uridine monophosphate kinase [Oscillospiraceae bacterium]|nr:uridine monophosphate kinase [Oscillospiraceae bacterium]
MPARYRRVVIKVSGESLAADSRFGIDAGLAGRICDNLAAICRMGIEVALVVGGGNFWRGRGEGDIGRVTSDNIGMLATAMNGLYLRDMMESRGIKARLQSAVAMEPMAGLHDARKVVGWLGSGEIVIFVCGLNLPYLSTDTTAAQRAVEIGADVILMGKSVDAVYDVDPNMHTNAVKYDRITYGEIMAKKIGIIDMASAAICNENGIEMILYDAGEPRNMIDAVLGEVSGTVISPG